MGYHIRACNIFFKFIKKECYFRDGRSISIKETSDVDQLDADPGTRSVSLEKRVDFYVSFP